MEREPIVGLLTDVQDLLLVQSPLPHLHYPLLQHHHYPLLPCPITSPLPCPIASPLLETHFPLPSIYSSIPSPFIYLNPYSLIQFSCSPLLPCSSHNPYLHPVSNSSANLNKFSLYLVQLHCPTSPPPLPPLPPPHPSPPYLHPVNVFNSSANLNQFFLYLVPLCSSTSAT